MRKGSSEWSIEARTCSSASCRFSSTRQRTTPASGNLIVLDRHFTYEPLGLAMQRGDENLRLLVDSALSEIYRSDGFRDAFTEWFGPPDDFFVTFFRQTALPE